MNLITYLKKDIIYLSVIILSFLSILRYLLIPLAADEITYFELAQNILKGTYYLNDQPSTVTPIIPFILSIFRALFGAKISVILMKCFFLVLTFFGFRFVYYFFKKQQLDIPIIASLIVLTLVNSNSIAWYMRLYPESILFFCFWGFLYYYDQEVTVENFKKVFFLFLLLLLTRYLYIVLGVFVLIYYYRCFQQQKVSRNINFLKIILYTIILLIPLFLWFRYVYITEQNQTIGISYFNRFKSDNIFIYNIKCGLGLLQHHEVSNINGIPAFISLFVPVTGLRNFPLSILLILLFIFGYIKRKKTLGVSTLFVAIILIMIGLIFAATGFSRYWLILLPGFYLGYYYAYKFLKLKDEWFVILAKIIAVFYVINELRLDYIILSRHI